ncbi:DUF2341 domain-containing protein [Dehalococcoides mccartyi]|uniref:Conserved domain protein n=1 Tax=Dehalococcoides mccartyi (strain ATCC BAA-2266 / KCTC 15142 / 195) TaxID=243164 RepID=Q3Z9Q9_DEHM1|nr:DUF2341 domain-containing protein [Dehalococcoides mccartyi]AAW39849.1 conserved domain protein [Dehalococcoides mccartyi 195]AAW40392.1 conserved domain protein [Dehalococcoides mccartyi 195]AAW40439.1 conserved domain protein [Dehalococcoides mccartyi 195]
MLRRLVKFISVIVLLAGLIIQPAASVTAADQLTVHFERIYESPVSVTFRVTITNEGKALPDLPLEVLFDGLNVSDLSRLTITELTINEYQVSYPTQFETIEESYTATGKLVLSIDASGQTLYQDVSLPVMDKSGNLVSSGGEIIKSGAYDRIDQKTGTVYWFTDIPVAWQTSTIQEIIPIELADWTAKSKSLKDNKLKTSISLPEKSLEKNPKGDTGWGSGTRVWDVTLSLPLLTTDSGWGSQGLMKWDLAGTIYYDDTNSSWWNNNWLYRRFIALDMTTISETLTNFPVYIKLDSTNFDFSRAQDNGEDIRFTDGVSNLDYEIVSWDSVSETAEIYVKNPVQLANVATDGIYMYYGNKAVSDGQNPAGVWSNGYVAVYHMSDASSTLINSSVGSLPGTKSGDMAAQTAGLLGYAQYFDGINDQIIVAYNAILDITSGSVEAIILPDSAGTDGYIFAKGNPALGYYCNTRYIGSINRIEWAGPSAVQSNNVFTDTDWTYISFTCNGRAISFYHNGTAAGSQTLSSDPDTNTDGLYIGNRMGGSSGSTYFDGLIDELRISGVVRSAAWLAATNLNLMSPDTFLIFGTEEGKPADPANLSADISGNNIELTWVKGDLSLSTVIVRGSLHYPESPDDGLVVYDGPAESFTDTGAAGELSTHYYRAWGYSGWGYSDGYSQDRTEGIMIGVIITLGLIAIAYIKRDIIMTIIAGISLLLLGYGIIDPDIGGNAIIQALPIILMSVYMIIRAAIYATNRREV